MNRMISAMRVLMSRELQGILRTRSFRHVCHFSISIARTKRRLLTVEEREMKGWMSPRQATVKIKVGEHTDQKEVLATLRHNFRITKARWLTFSKRPTSSAPFDLALVILGTPTFAKWLEDDTKFIPKVLEILNRPFDDFWGNFKQGQSKPKNSKDHAKPAFEIDVICACVDGLAPRIEHLNRKRLNRPLEGLSFLHGRLNQITPGLWDPETSNTHESPGMQSSLTFSTRTQTTQVTLPLAKTLFTNGRHSTLIISKWRALADGTFIKVKSAEKMNQFITVFDSQSQNIPCTSIPVTPLTPVRRIVSCLGNIVRQINFGEEGDGPASRELEASIDNYFEFSQRPKATVDVWALIFPPDSLPHSPPGHGNDLLLHADAVKKFWQDEILSTEFVGYWLNRGATFCRVLSGGGGWGVKQGLLSLDPQTTYSTVNEARFDFSTGTIEEQRSSALGNIAQANSLIQFFVADSRKLLRMSILNGGKRALDVFQDGTVVGTAPSTIDEIPQEDPLPVNGSSEPRSRNRHMFFQVGHFGAVSESGLYLSSNVVKSDSEQPVMSREDHLIKTKIDFPYSYVFRDLKYEKEGNTPRFAKRHVLEQKEELNRLDGID